MSLLAMVGISSCSYGDLVIKGKEGAPSWTIMVYMCGADLESGHDYLYDANGNVIYDNYGEPKVDPNPNGLATMDISEMLSVHGQPKNVNVVIQTGGAKEWAKTYGISANEIGRYHVRDQKLVKDAGLTKANMGAQSTFESFLEWGLTTYPADKTGLIMWNHGGALDGVCYDENYNGDSLTNQEMKAAFTKVFTKLNRTEKLEWIGYDACLMAIQDIAEFNSSYFNYMVAAEETEVGYGWEYSSWLDDVYMKRDTQTILKAICDGFVESIDELADIYAKEYGEQFDNDQNLAVIDLNKMNDYKVAFETMATAVGPTIKSNSSSFKTLMKSVKSYADMTMDREDYQYYINYYNYPSSWFTYSGGVYTLHGYNLYGNFDAKDMLDKMYSNSMFSSYKTVINNARNALNATIMYNKKGSKAGNSNGLCSIVPMNNNFEYSLGQTSFVVWRAIFA